MPKRYTSRTRKSYAPRKRTPTTKKPYGSRYGNDAFVKIEYLDKLSPIGVIANIYSTMRVNAIPGALPGLERNHYLAQQPEFLSFQALYARYEVVGMRMETALNARTQWASANMAGGLAPRMANPAIFPTEANNVTYPMQKDCATQGEVTSLYYAYSKDLKNSGATYAVSTETPYADIDQGILQFRGETGAAVTGDVGTCKMTWYVRFHGRTRPGGITPIKEEIPPQTEMSYADLQQQIKDLMSK